ISPRQKATERGASNAFDRMTSSSIEPASQLSKHDRFRAERYLKQTITIVPLKHASAITPQEIAGIVSPSQVLLIADEEKGNIWARGLNIKKEELLARLNRDSKGRFFCPAAGSDCVDPTEKARLSKAQEVIDKDQPHQSSIQEPSRSSQPSSALTYATRKAYLSPKPSASGSAIQHAKPTSATVGRVSVSTDIKGRDLKNVESKNKSNGARTSSDEKGTGDPSTDTSTSGSVSSAISQNFNLHDLPYELLAWIIQLSLEELNPAERARRLYDLLTVTHYVQDAMKSSPSLWDTVHSDSTQAFNKFIIDRFEKQALSLYYRPEPGHSERIRWGKFLRLLGPQSYRWRTLDAVIIAGSLPSLTQALEQDLPCLKSLSVKVTQAPWLTGSRPADPLEKVVWDQVGRQLNLLNGSASGLRRLSFVNVPGRLNLNPFTNLFSLHLRNAVQITYSTIIAWIKNGGAKNLNSLYISNVKWFGVMVPPTDEAEAINLENLRTLTLIEAWTNTGIVNLLYHIIISSCMQLHLHLSTTNHFVGQQLARRLVPIIQRSFEVKSHTCIKIVKDSKILWTGGEVASGEDGLEFGPGFQIGYTKNRFGTQLDQPAQFINFIRQATNIAYPTPILSLDINDSLSRVRDGAPGTDPNRALLRMQFDNLVGVTDISAIVVQDHFGSLTKMLKGPHATLPRLNSIHFSLLPEMPDASGVLPSVLAKHSLQALIDDLNEVYERVEVDEDLFGERDDTDVMIRIWGPSTSAE
ncbi:hypothetical protein FRB90_002471, partial [Tulasnella sp. 427]